MKKDRCKYCGVKLKGQNICGNCCNKLKRVRELKEILNRIIEMVSDEDD